MVGSTTPARVPSSVHRWARWSTTPHTHAYGLQNIRFWNMSDSDGLALLFGRLFTPEKTNLTGMAQNSYMEANLAGAPPLPSGVRAIIGDFG